MNFNIEIISWCHLQSWSDDDQQSFIFRAEKNRTGSAAPQRSQLRDSQIRVCWNVQITHYISIQHLLFSKACRAAWVQLVSALCCSGSVGPGPAHLAVRLIMSDMITTELAAVYFHIYPEAANRIWFSAKRRLLIELMRLSCSRLENQLTKTKNKNRFWSSFRTQRGNRSERCSQSYREQCLAPAAWFLFEVSAPNMYRGNFLFNLNKSCFYFPKRKTPSRHEPLCELHQSLKRESDKTC